MKLLNNLQFNDKSQAPSHHNTPLYDNRVGYFPLARGMKLMMPSENSVFPRSHDKSGDHKDAKHGS